MRSPVPYGPRGADRRTSTVMFSILLLAVWAGAVLTALAGPLIAPVLGLPDPAEPVARPFTAPGPGHPLGTDRVGRDVLARLCMGNMVLVIPPALAAAASTVSGTAVGLTTALCPRLRPWIRFLTDTLLVIPPMIMLLAVISANGVGLPGVTLMAVILSLPLSSRYLEAAAKPVVSSGYVEVRRAAGVPFPVVVIGDVLPAMRRALFADLGIRYVGVVFLTATTAFLGATVGTGTRTWASMVPEALAGLALNPWAAAAPVLLIIALTAPPAILIDIVTGGGR
ncbi:ABC transporter permease [Corynebacterium antarcticum]|uniref:ABC transporter permease n=1 Tax=Corynebacterium antarcticum TaxID=2800405 RepID=UPI00200509FE|nr:ABC transporter permease subunit [Corynebacterium antarcticum]MCK7660129.1 ABC transporter permease subunit [Corynebacterium antarcticum]